MPDEKKLQGFDSGLDAEKMLGATDTSGILMWPNKSTTNAFKSFSLKNVLHGTTLRLDLRTSLFSEKFIKNSKFKIFYKKFE